MLCAQQKVDSPVFKRRALPQPPLLKTSDVLEDIWQAFLASRKANAGDPIAQQELGIRYLTGRGVEPDSGKAAYWFSKAAAQNVLAARFNLGILSFNGWGVDWNPFEAFRAFHVAAEGGMPEAQYIVGLFYAENMVVPIDFEKALYWVRKAAENGSQPAKDGLPELERSAERYAAQRKNAQTDSLLQTTPSVLVTMNDTSSAPQGTTLLQSAMMAADPDMRRALGLAKLLDSKVQVDSVGLRALTAAANVGSPEAMTLLGKCSEQGLAVPVDEVVALGYFVRAARMGSPQAAELLQSLVARPHVLQNLKAKAKREDPDAECTWGALLALGFSGALYQAQAFLTPAQAVQMMKKSADRGYAPAMIELGLWYFSGRWVPSDPVHAMELWRSAARVGSREAELRIAAINLQTDADSAAFARDLAVINAGMEDGSVLAEVALAYCYESGRGLPVRLPEAVRLYRVAARRGSLDAYRALRRLHDARRPKDKEFVVSEDE
jgi:uncharacterized protein